MMVVTRKQQNSDRNLYIEGYFEIKQKYSHCWIVGEVHMYTGKTSEKKVHKRS